MSFTFRPAVREATPLLIGLVGPTWTGKTYSALRLASGIVKARGGKIVGIDTEARRMLQYANEFKFEYLEFGEPFSSIRYAEALKAAAAEARGGCVIVDSMSHEHEGMGGYLDFHEKEVQRLVKDGGFKNEYSAGIPAWNKPAQDRRKLINVVLQLNCSFVFCFRAKEKIKPVKGGNPLELGWQAIAGEEFGFEMTVRCLLLPGAKGVPTWSAEAQRLGVPKRIKDHESILKDGAQLDERTGELLSAWSSGAPKESAPPAPVKRLDSLSPIMSDTKQAGADHSTTAPGASPSVAPSAHDGHPNAVAYITTDQATDLLDRLREAGIDAKRLCKVSGVETINQLPAHGYQRACDWISKARETK